VHRTKTVLIVWQNLVPGRCSLCSFLQASDIRPNSLIIHAPTKTFAQPAPSSFKTSMASAAGPSNAAPAAPQISSWERTVQTFDLLSNEQAFYENLPTFWREDFRLFCIGFKIHRNGQDAQNSATTSWITLTEEEREPYIRIGEQTPDPRLDPRNFEFRASERNEWERLGDADQETFESFTAGLKIKYPAFLKGKSFLISTIPRSS
jgi:hypothetical protein